MPEGEVIDDPHYTTPLYHKAEAAHIIAIPAQTFRNWAVGYARKRLDGSQVVSAPIVTTLEPARPQGVSVSSSVSPKRTSWPHSPPRPGCQCSASVPPSYGCRTTSASAQALASQRLQTDGAEVLWDFGRQSGDPADQDMVNGLVVVRSGQQVFRPVVRDYLTRVTYEGGWTRRIQLPQYGSVDVVVDPWLNSGPPTVAERGIRVVDIVNRLNAQKPAKDVADDYDLTVKEVEQIRRAA